MTIGELASHFGLATHVLRHWESVGLLAPAERVNGRRRYDAGQAARITLILRAKEAGLTLEQLRLVLGAPDAEARRALLREHLADLERRLREIEAAKELILHAMECPADDFTRCGAFQSIASRPPAESAAPLPADAGGTGTVAIAHL